MKSPSPEEIKGRRQFANLTQEQAATLVHSKLRTWQRWEAGISKMHPAIWELFTIITRR